MIGGLTYNWIIFMILPLYVSLEKIDPRLLEASRDLYGTNRRMFGKVILPLAMPGVLAGSLLVFIPSVGDFINADYLGSTQTTMIGNVIQKQFLVVKDYPAAAALSFVLMATHPGGCAALHPGAGHRGPGMTTRRPGGRGATHQRSATLAEPGRNFRGTFKLGDIALRVLAGLMLLFLFLPILVIIVFSFNKPRRQVQLHLAGLHAGELAAPVQVPGADQRPEAEHQRGRRLDRDRPGARHAGRRCPCAPTIPGQHRRWTPSWSCR